MGPRKEAMDNREWTPAELEQGSPWLQSKQSGSGYDDGGGDKAVLPDMLVSRETKA